MTSIFTPDPVAAPLTDAARQPNDLPHGKTRQPPAPDNPAPAAEVFPPGYPDPVEVLPFVFQPVTNDPLVSSLHWLLVKAMHHDLLMEHVALGANIPLAFLEGLANGTIKPNRHTLGHLRQLSEFLTGNPEYLVLATYSTPSRAARERLLQRMAEHLATKPAAPFPPPVHPPTCRLLRPPRPVQPSQDFEGR